MEKSVIERLEIAVTCLESLSIGSSPPAILSRDRTGDDFSSDSSILAFDELVEKSLPRVSVATKKIGWKVLDATKVLEEAIAIEKDLIVNAKKCKVSTKGVCGKSE